MKIYTKRFGEIIVRTQDIVTFPDGLVGFSSKRRFVVLKETDGPFFWMQSLEDPALAFVITNPLIFVPDYRIRIHRSQLQLIELEDLSKGELWVLVSIRHNPLRVSINLQGPVLVNKANRLAVQLVLDSQEYPLRYEILRAEKVKEEVAG